MKLSGIPASSFEGMNNLRHDYDVCYSFHKEWDLYGLHCHDFYELYIHYGGAKFYCIDNDVYPLQSGQLIVIPPFHMHGLFSDTVLKDYERGFIYLTPAMLRTCGGGSIDLERFISNYVQSGKCTFQLSPEDAQTCKRILQDTARQLQSPNTLVRYENYVNVLSFLSIVCNTMHRTEAIAETVVVNEVIHDILAYVNEHFTLPLKLEGLARQFGVSVSFLSHEFVKCTGRSVYDYILHRRVMQAKALINSACSLNEVAYRCGFNDYSSFLRVFSKMAGMSPSAYRKMKSNLPIEE